MAKNKQFLSPQVAITEEDRTFSTTSVGVTTAGVTGESIKGPAFSPMLINSYDEYKRFFGPKNPKKFKDTQIPKYEGSYIAESFLNQSNQLFFTRVLGLSGYDKGDAYTLTTIGAPDLDTLSYQSSGTTTIKFYIDNNDNFRYRTNTIDVNNDPFLIDKVKNEINNSANGSFSIVNEDFDSTFNTFFRVANNPPYENDTTLNILKWGYLRDKDKNHLEAQYSATTYVNAYELPADIPESNEKQHWLDEYFTYDMNTDEFNGLSFAIYTNLSSLNTSNASAISGNTIGEIKLYHVNYKIDPIKEYHKKLAATVRSRGIYIADKLFYNINPDPVTGGTLTISDSSEITTDPFGTFSVSGITEQNGDNFAYTVSLDPEKRDFAKNVLGTDNFDRSTNIYVEELYDQFLRYGIQRNTIKGLMPNFTKFTTWNQFNNEFTTPETPYIVSELKGGEAKRLFRFISISDGYNGNYEIKASIANINLSTKTFDVQIRAYNDRDTNPVILERYFNCSMEPRNANYIGKRIGTVDGQYQLVSNYVTIEIVDDAPSDAVPAGFEGYEFRADPDQDVGIPKVTYKTKYYNAGETIYKPIRGQPVISNGDKIRKNYLGFSDRVGIEDDLLTYKGTRDMNGNPWSYTTKGFHLDLNANTDKFEVGESGFTDVLAIARDPQHPYNEVGARKFTVLFSGGFDGWDMFRKWRTNTDNYIIGNIGFTEGGFETFIHDEFKTLFGTSDYYSYLYGIRTFENPETVNINILATPGIDLINHSSLINETVEMVEEERKDVFYIPTLPDIKLYNNTDPADTANFYFPSDITARLNAKGYDTSYAGTFYPWIQKRDNENGVNIFLPPTAEVFRNIAFTDKVQDPWYAIAGYSRGVLNAIRTRDINLTQDVRDLLYDNKINPIPTFSDVGPIIWGNKNLYDENSVLNRINIRRLLIQAESLIKNVGKRLLFDPNDDRVEDEFESQVNPILANIAEERGLDDFRVQVNNNAEDLDRNTLSGVLYLKPTPALEYMDLTFVVTDTTESFET